MNTRKLLVTILMFVSVILAACAPAAMPPVPTVVPSTAIPTAASAPIQALTTFSPKTFKLPVTFRYGSEWHIAEEYSDVVSLAATGFDGYFSFIDPKSIKIAGPAAPYSAIPFPADFVTWIQSHDLFQVVKTQPVIVGGFQGTQIDANATPACGTKTNWLFLANTGWNCGDGVHYRFIYLDDVNSERLLIMLEGFSSAQDFMSKVAASQQILDTVVFSKPAAAADITFSPKTFKLPMKSSFGPDWKVAYDVPGKFAIDNKHDFGLAYYIVTAAKLADPMDGHLIPFPEDFLAWLKSNPDFNVVTSTPVTIAGIQGLQIDATPIWKSTTTHLKLFLSLSGDITRNLEGQPDGENIVTDPEQWRFILLNDVNGERVLIMLIDGNGHDFQDAVSQSQAVLDSVVFTK